MSTRFDILLEMALYRVLSEDALQTAQEKLDKAVLNGSLQIGINEIRGGKLMLMQRYVPGLTPEELAALQSNKLWYLNDDGSWYVVCRHPKSPNAAGPTPKPVANLVASNKAAQGTAQRDDPKKDVPLPGKTANVEVPAGVDPKDVVRTIAKLIGAFRTGLLRTDTYEVGSPTGILSRLKLSDAEISVLKRLNLFTKTGDGFALNQKRLAELLGAFDDLRRKYYD